MTELETTGLRIHRGPEADPKFCETKEDPLLTALCHSFSQATGWPLTYVPDEQASMHPDPLWSAPVGPGVGTPLGHLTIGAWCPPHPQATCGNPGNALAGAKRLASCLADLLSQLQDSTAVLATREAKLATAAPLLSQPPDAACVAIRLEAILNSGTTALGYQAAGLYLLDAATTELKLHSAWQLSAASLSAPVRPLQTARADLEAMSGHAIAVQDGDAAAYWEIPESFPAALCIPVSSVTTVLGTLWFFCREPHKFSDQETNLAEIIAGRLAAELECEALISECFRSYEVETELDGTRRLQQSQLPSVAPATEGWEIFGSTETTKRLGSNFHDWFATGTGLGITVADTHNGGFRGALVAQAVRTALRTQAMHDSCAGRILTRSSQHIWSSFSGNQFSSAAFFYIEPGQETVRWASAGQLVVWVLRANGLEFLSPQEIPLGVTLETVYQERRTTLAIGEALVIVSSGVSHSKGPPSEWPIADWPGEVLQQHNCVGAEELALAVRRVLAHHAVEPASFKGTVLVIRRQLASERQIANPNCALAIPSH